MIVWALSLLGLLAAVVPSFQQFQNHLFHLLGRVAFREILMQLVAGERYPVKLAFLLFRHDGAHHVDGQMPSLAEFLQPLRLGDYSEKKELMNVDEIEVTPSITVHLEGAVLKEGDYTFDEVMTIEEMLELVGTSAEADLNQVALKELISPELLVYVPYQKEGLISLNHGTFEELQTIKGIGPKKAQAIIDGRPYTCLEDLMNVKGIGETTYRKLREYFCL